MDIEKKEQARDKNGIVIPASEKSNFSDVSLLKQVNKAN